MPSPFQGKILPSFLTNAPDLSLALANFNFDFTLYKAPAPPEYNGLGNALSERRRVAAEGGHEHIIARKLGRLFHNSLPSVPTLISAYGQRASDIAHSESTNSSGSRANGVFTDYVGADGTSIWAAATSSHEAICVHLLACMLARIWPAPHATAIWFELTTERQVELAKLDPNDPLHVSDAAAARLELTREDLANWDASARAWLSIADAAMKKQQTQLLLLVDKTKLPVDVSKGVYASVMNVWVTALEVIDKILGGMSHNVQGGSVLLGLASWHLFPDMHLVTKPVPQHDSIISPNAGILTFGIERPSEDVDDGVYWSLPLAHLRYYGEPVRSMGNMGTKSLRLTKSEFQLVVFGSVLARLGRYSQNVLGLAELISSMQQFLESKTHSVAGAEETGTDYVITTFAKRNTWFKLLADAADDLLSSDALGRHSRLALIARGSRRYEAFLAPIQSFQRPLFDIWSAKTLIALLHEEGVVHFLRRIIRRSNLDPARLVIRYWHIPKTVLLTPQAASNDVFLTTSLADFAERTDEVHHLSNGSSPREPYPEDYVNLADSNIVDSKKPKKYKRKKGPKNWYKPRKRKRTPAATIPENPEEKSPEASNDSADGDQFKKFYRKAGELKDGYFEYASALPYDDIQASADENTDREASRCHIRWIECSDKDESRQRSLRESGEILRHFDAANILDLGEDSTAFSWRTYAEWKPGEYSETVQSFEELDYMHVFGDPRIGAIYTTSEADIDTTDDLELADVTDAFRNRCVNPRLFLERLSELGRNEAETDHQVIPIFVRSLQGIAAALIAYKLMPNATITTSVFSAPIYEANWMPQPQRIATKPDNLAERKLTWLEVYTLDRPNIFACIAMFENRHINVDPKGLGQVMALSTVNSIYVAMPLLCDPAEQPQSYEIRHVVGNIGQPGISFLIPPPEPKIKKVDEDNWAIVNHSLFDGNYEDHFEFTSMHLSFTKLSIPVGLDFSSGQDTEAYFRQTLVSLIDGKGRWIADLDILGALQSPIFDRLKPLKMCKHSAQRRKQPSFQLKSIDNWDELLDRPKCPGILRARGNWLARLAATVLNVQLGFPTFVLSTDGNAGGSGATTDVDPQVCWACASDVLARKRRPGKDMNNYIAEELPVIIA